MESLRTELKIPRERIAVLIGKEGAIKREIEESTKTRLDIDSKEGDVFISGPDGLGIYTAKEIVTAIGRGFNPEIAMLLLKVDYSFENLNLQEYMGKSKQLADLFTSNPELKKQGLKVEAVSGNRIDLEK